MKVQRYKCKCDGCDYDQQENIPFATGSCSYTHRFAKHVVDLLRSMTLKDAASRLDISWDMVKEIHSRYLESHYSPPSLDGVECIGIDEFAVKKGHIYKTIVVDLLSGRILHVGEGKGIEALADFWKKVRRKNISIKYVATIWVHQEFGVMGLYVQSLFTVNAFFPPFRLRVFFSSYSLQI